jgi:hypothetical protein
MCLASTHIEYEVPELGTGTFSPVPGYGSIKLRPNPGPTISVKQLENVIFSLKILQFLCFSVYHKKFPTLTVCVRLLFKFRFLTTFQVSFSYRIFRFSRLGVVTLL